MSSKTAQTVRSETVAYWTGGKDIQQEHKKTGDSCKRRDCYLNRLKGTLLGSKSSGGKAGLWMKRKPIELYIGPANSTKVMWWYTCFTEVKRKESFSHIQRYGHLGFVFNREFILGRYGVPVLYIPGLKERDMTPQKKQHIISHHVQKILDNCFAGMNRAMKAMETSSKDCYPREYQAFKSLASSIITIGLFAKEMSDDSCSCPFELLEECEWRVPFVIKRPDLFVETGLRDPKYVMPFGPSDLQLIVVPDCKTRELALGDDDILGWFGDSAENIERKIKTVKEYTSS